MSATWDRFHGAAKLLAGAGPVKQRLADAYRKYLVDLEIDELPRELRAEFQSLAASLTARRAMGGQDAIDTTVRKFSDAQAASYAARLITIYGSLAQSQVPAQRGPALRAINSSQG
jgi:5'-deoxynucleotidase YfbR-like HD superfamily hydrolase